MTLLLYPAGHSVKQRFLQRLFHRLMKQDMNFLLGPPWVPDVIYLPASTAAMRDTLLIDADGHLGLLRCDCPRQRGGETIFGGFHLRGDKAVCNTCGRVR